jgi:hypothetical protein
MKKKADVVLRGRNAQRYWVRCAINRYAEGLAMVEETADQILSLFESGTLPRFVRMVPIPEQVDALGCVLANLDEVLMTDNERAEALVWAWEGMRAQGIEAGTSETPQEARSEGRKPGPKDAPKGGAQRPSRAGM